MGANPIPVAPNPGEWMGRGFGAIVLQDNDGTYRLQPKPIFKPKLLRH